MLHALQDSITPSLWRGRCVDPSTPPSPPPPKKKPAEGLSPLQSFPERVSKPYHRQQEEIPADVDVLGRTRGSEEASSISHLLSISPQTFELKIKKSQETHHQQQKAKPSLVHLYSQKHCHRVGCTGDLMKQGGRASRRTPNGGQQLIPPAFHKRSVYLLPQRLERLLQRHEAKSRQSLGRAFWHTLSFLQEPSLAVHAIFPFNL